MVAALGRRAGLGPDRVVTTQDRLFAAIEAISTRSGTPRAQDLLNKVDSSPRSCSARSPVATRGLRGNLHGFGDQSDAHRLKAALAARMPEGTWHSPGPGVEATAACLPPK